MPQRFLRPGIRTSERFNSVSFKAQTLFIKLLTLVDDFGRYDGRPAVICGDCFSVWNDLNQADAVNPQETAALCQQLSASKLVEFYESEGKKTLQVTQWQERARSETSKWPARNDNPLRNPAESCGILPPSPLAISHKPVVISHSHDAVAVATALAEQELLEKPEVRSKRKGSMDELKRFCAALGLPESDGVTLYHKWEGNGWTNNGRPIKSWSSTITSWKSAGYLPSQKGIDPRAHGTTPKIERTPSQKGLASLSDKLTKMGL